MLMEELEVEVTRVQCRGREWTVRGKDETKHTVDLYNPKPTKGGPPRLWFVSLAEVSPCAARSTKAKKSMDEIVRSYLEKPYLPEQLNRALELLSTRGEAGITTEELNIHYTGKTKLGKDPCKSIRNLRKYGAIIPDATGTNGLYVMQSPPIPRSVEQRTKDAIVSEMAKALTKLLKKQITDAPVEEEEEESMERDAKFGKLVRESSNGVDFLGGTDPDVHAAMHIFAHAKGGTKVDLRSNGVLGDHNTNSKDRAGTLNFYVRGEQKIVVISEGYGKGEYVLPALFDADEELAQKLWILLANMGKNVTQDIPEWFWAWATKYVHEDYRKAWEAQS